MATRAQRNKQDIVRSPKDRLHPVTAGSIDPPAKPHDESKQESPIIEKRVDALPVDLSQMRHSDPTKGFVLAAANMEAYHAKLLEMMQGNVQSAFEFGLRLATIRSPIEFFAVIAEFIKRRIDMFGKYSQEIAAYPFWRIEAVRELTALPGR
jgi:hypothetical protein